MFFLVFLLEFYKLEITKRLSGVQQASHWEAFHGDFQFQLQYLQLLNVQVPQFSASNLGQICTYKTTQIRVRASPAEGLVEHSRALVIN